MSEATTVLLLFVVGFAVTIVDRAPEETQWIVQLAILGAIATVVARGELHRTKRGDQ